MNKNLKVVFFGTPLYVVPVLKKLQDNFNVVGVVTAADKKVGRKQILTPSPIKMAFNNFAVTFAAGKLDQKLIDKLKKLNPHLFVVAAYGKIIPKSILDIPKYGSLNIHPSILPKYRGPSPIQAAILNGDKTTGATIMVVDEKMDHGPIVSTKKIRLSSKDDNQTLSNKLFQEGVNLLVKVIPDFINGKLKLRPQNHKKAIYCKTIEKRDGYFDISNPPDPQKLDMMVRAYYPWPSVWTQWKNKIVKFYPQKLVQMEGKKAMPIKDFLNGYPDFPLIPN